ncbi:sulfite exporter TauE/SafE family protein [Candidatus Micrarchaeota archaeon]|nr:sulfite exporter TauE/SafE family protein [Candidatus Micrarchaeota archaeon]MBU1681411.1 sulfite exporter TauE/SafE family protein [Candidatus Micrarchaeota archaeon]
MKTIKLKTKGMECHSCAQSIEATIKKLDGVSHVKSNYQNEMTEILFDESKIDEEVFITKIKDLGFTMGDDSSIHSKFGSFAIALGIITILASVYLLIRNDINFDFNNISMETGFATLFILGFFTGFHCIGMCGGFVLSYTKNLKNPGDLLPHILYGSGKTLSYTVFGALFGLVGSFIAFTIELRAGVAIFAGLFLVLYGVNMLNLIPVLRKAQLKIPSIIPLKWRRSHGPLVTGLLNGLMIACGPLQALYIFAAGTGSPMAGAQALFFFGLGTLAPLLTFGVVSNFLSAAFSHNIVKFSGILVIFLGLAMASNGLNLLGVGILPADALENDTQINITLSEDNYQVIKMEVNRYGWEPNSFILKRGIPVKWEIDAKELNGCNNEIIVLEFDLDIKLKPGLQTVEFTPESEGTIRWSCWMGMIPGQFVVLDDIEITDSGTFDSTEVVVPELPSDTSCDGSCGGSCTGGCGCGG